MCLPSEWRKVCVTIKINSGHFMVDRCSCSPRTAVRDAETCGRTRCAFAAAAAEQNERRQPEPDREGANAFRFSGNGIKFAELESRNYR